MDAKTKILELNAEQQYEVRRALEFYLKKTKEGLNEPWIPKMPELKDCADHSMRIVSGVMIQLDD